MEFEYQFADWLISCQGSNLNFITWLAEHGKHDFRQTLVSHADFLLKQTCDMDSSYTNFPVWREICPHQASLNCIKSPCTLSSPFILASLA